MKFVVLLLFAFSIAGCARPVSNIATVKQEAIPKPEIESAIRSYIEANQTKRPIEGFSYKRYDASIYLVGVKFKDVEGRALNVVARKYDDIGWKIESYSDQWRSILRMDPE